MSREKQIEGMAIILNPDSCFEGDITACRKMEDCAICKATKLYNAGYRKQTEGEWLEINDGVLIGDGKHLECSECGVWKKDKQKSNFCSNCGAKMKGGAE